MENKPLSLKCPECGAPLPYKLGVSVVKCEYCETPVRISDEGLEKIKDKERSREGKEEILEAVGETVRDASSLVWGISSLLGIPMRIINAIRSTVIGCFIAIALFFAGIILLFFIIFRR